MTTDAARGHEGGFRPDVQGLRAAAVLLVLLFHADLGVFSGGFVGVDVFFVLSGFVIGRNLLREIDRTGTISLRGFYTRRVRRILPPLAVVLVLSASAALVLQSPSGARNTVQTAAATTVFAANVKLALDPHGYFDAVPGADPLLHMWSLSVEEQFYFFAPALLLFGLWTVRRREHAARLRTLTFLLALVGSVSFGACLLVAHTQLFSSVARAQSFAFYGSPFRAWEFVSGLLLAILDRSSWKAQRGVAMILGGVGVALLTYAATSFDAGTLWPSSATLLPVLGTSAILVANGAAPRGVIARSFALRPIVWVGDISYSLYLWHFPLVVFAANVWSGGVALKLAATGVAFLPAWLSTRFFERPVVRREYVPATRKLLAFCLVVPAAAALFGGFVANRLRVSSRFVRLAAETAPHADVENGCDRSSAVWDSQRCTWVSPGATKTILLVGDSQAGALTEAVVDSARTLQNNATVRTMSECPFLDVQILKWNIRDEKCSTHNASILADVDRLVAETLVVSFFANGYLSSEKYRFIDAGGSVAVTPLQKRLMMTASLSRILAQSERLGVSVVIVEPPAPFAARRMKDCPTLLVLRSERPCEGVLSRRAYDEALTQARTVFAGTTPSSATVSLSEMLCSVDRCATTAKDVLLLRDNLHLSVGGSHLFAPMLAAAIERANASLVSTRDLALVRAEHPPVVPDEGRECRSPTGRRKGRVRCG